MTASPGGEPCGELGQVVVTLRRGTVTALASLCSPHKHRGLDSSRISYMDTDVLSRPDIQGHKLPASSYHPQGASALWGGWDPRAAVGSDP